MTGFRERRDLFLYSAGWLAVRALPERAAYATFRTIADIAWRRRTRAVRGLERNLARVVPGASAAELRSLSKDAARSYMRYWCDAFRIGDWDRDRVVERVRTIDEERLREPLSQGRGVVVALPHMANFDHAGAWAALNGLSVASVAERLHPEGLFEKFVAYRERIGITIYPLTGGDVDIMAELAERLTDGGLVCLPAERDLSQRGVPVTFFGEPTRMPAGPAMLALRTGAVLLPLTLAYEGQEPGHGIVLNFHEPVPVPEERTNRIATMTQGVADAFAAGIRQYPADWHMAQRLFLSDLQAASADRPRSDKLAQR